jgi:NitT/TauT family transport system permease protein
MLAMVALFPTRQLGLETGRDPAHLHRAGLEHGVQLLLLAQEHADELREAADIYNFSAWQRFWQIGDAVFRDRPGVELHGLSRRRMVRADRLRNVHLCAITISACRGLGSYLQTSASHGDTSAMLWGLP